MELQKTLKKIGIQGQAGMLWPVFEDDFIKFMSDGGNLDDEQGHQFKKWLDDNGFYYERTGPRSFLLGMNAVKKLNDIFQVELDDRIGRQGIDNKEYES